MPSAEKIIDDLRATSDKLSEITRTISLSVIALVWLFVAGGDNVPTLPAKPSSGLLLLSGLFALLALLADYGQYAVGYANSKDILGVAEASDTKSASYNTKAALYRVRGGFFWLKQFFAILGLVFLFSAVLRAYICG